ncbi:hypothetical protein BX616_000266 [Lobosporangium transversale]|nr:hypothetical protein BX616_000266 [Lobosporangium transversale]
MGQSNSTPSRTSRRSRSRSLPQRQQHLQEHHAYTHSATPTQSTIPRANRAMTLPQSHVNTSSHVTPTRNNRNCSSNSRHNCNNNNNSNDNSNYSNDGDPSLSHQNIQNHMPQSLSRSHSSQLQQQTHQAQQNQNPMQPSQPTHPLPAGSSGTSATAITPARVVRSTTRRRRLLAAFYPLLSRNRNSRTPNGNDSNNENSSSSNSNNNNNNNNNSSSSRGNNDNHNRGNNSAGHSINNDRRNPGINNVNSSNGGANGSFTNIRTTQDNRTDTPGGSSVANNRRPAEPRTAQSTSRHRQSDRTSHTHSPRPAQTRSQTLQAVSGTRTPRGVSRVRRYDEQSIRSFRSSSSRSSSLLALSPSSTTTAASLHPHVFLHHTHRPSSEPMEVDLEPTAVSYAQAEVDSGPRENHRSSDLETMPHNGATSVSGSSGVMDMGYPSRLDTSLFVARSNPRVGTSISSSLLPIRPDSEDEDDDGFFSSDAHSQRWRTMEYEQAHNYGQLNTSSDTASLPTRYRLDIADHGLETNEPTVTATNVGSISHRERRPRASRPSRYPPPEMVADLIQHQIVQGIAEAAATTAAAGENTRTLSPQSPNDMLNTDATAELIPSSSPPTATMTSNNNNSNSNNTPDASLEEAAPITERNENNLRADITLGDDDSFAHRNSRVHRRRLRSSSLRGLLGFPPAGSSGNSERVVGTGLDRGFTPVHRERAGTGRSLGSAGSSGSLETLDQRRLVESQIPFFARLLAEIGRSLRGQQGQGDDGDRTTTDGSSALDGSDGMATAATSAGATFTVQATIRERSTLSEAMGMSPLTNAEGSVGQTTNPVRARQGATVRFIQIGGSGGLAAFGQRRPRSESVTLGQGQEQRQGQEQEQEQRQGQGEEQEQEQGQGHGHGQGQRSGLGIGFGLGSRSRSGSSRSEPSEPSMRGRRDEFTEAILMFLNDPASGAGSDNESPESPTTEGNLSSLLAGGMDVNDSEGLSYDDLWMLSNLIGPARPVTTTQEAIDDAGFHVGQFENAAQGMRGFEMLGDGSKCLVCMSDYEEGEELRALRCKHGFHQACIDKWLTTGANKCPVCRAAAVEPSTTNTPVATAATSAGHDSVFE